MTYVPPTEVFKNMALTHHYRIREKFICSTMNFFLELPISTPVNINRPKNTFASCLLKIVVEADTPMT